MGPWCQLASPQCILVLLLISACLSSDLISKPSISDIGGICSKRRSKNITLTTHRLVYASGRWQLLVRLLYIHTPPFFHWVAKWLHHARPYMCIVYTMVDWYTRTHVRVLINIHAMHAPHYTYPRADLIRAMRVLASVIIKIDQLLTSASEFPGVRTTYDYVRRYVSIPYGVPAHPVISCRNHFQRNAAGWLQVITST